MAIKWSEYKHKQPKDVRTEATEKKTLAALSNIERSPRRFFYYSY